jgi:type I restriction enzyme S subunit
MIRNGQDYKDVADPNGEIPVMGSGGEFARASTPLFDGESVLLGRKGTIDKPLYIKGPFWPVDTMFYTLIQDQADGRFVYYAATSIPFDYYSSNTALPSMTQEDLGSHILVAPKKNEQKAIAAALDRETARIDALIAKKTRFIELLKEKRQALITHAVTTGLDPNVKMKDSGVEWIGEVPEHWAVVPSTWLFVESNERAHGDDEHLSATQKYGVIPLAEYERLEGRQVTHAVKNLEQRKHVEVDNFVISMRSFEGGIERVRARGCVRSSYVVLHAEPAADVAFFTYLLKSSTYIQGLQATSSFVRDGQDLSYANFRQVKMPAPCIAEQRAIAAHLDRGIARIDALTSMTDRSITLLKERRSALVTAAVTGQIDLRGATATTTEHAA